MYQKWVPLKAFQKLAGHLQHISFIMPGGWGLLSPIHCALQGGKKGITITLPLQAALQDWCTIIKQAVAIPTHILQLVNGLPDFLGYCNSCRIGVGGVLMGITKNMLRCLENPMTRGHTKSARNILKSTWMDNNE